MADDQQWFIRHWTSERDELTKLYPGKKWAEKVKNMSDAQVHATFVSIMQRREKQKNG